jgi:hypothetical protein
MAERIYTVKKWSGPDDLALQAPEWNGLPEARLKHFHKASSVHRPRVSVRMARDTQGLRVRFDVQDQFVLSREIECNRQVCGDSCVEFFVWPYYSTGYFNFEMNAGGTLLVYFIQNPKKMPGGFAKFEKISSGELALLKVGSCLPRVIERELKTPLAWSLALYIPWSFFVPYCGKLNPLKGECWRANFYKCADRSSHPHWGAWNSIGSELNFHQPERFGTLRFD